MARKTATVEKPFSLASIKVKAAASNGSAAVCVGLFCGEPNVIAYAPRDVGSWHRRAEFMELCERAMHKLGYRKDKSSKTGWVEAA